MTDAATLLTPSGEPFTTSGSEYLDGYPGLDEDRPRIYVKFRPEGTPASYLALLDTGGHFCILSQEVIRLVEDQLTDSLGEMVLRTAHGPVPGELYMLRIQLVGEMGDHLGVDAVVFIAPDWQGPNFLGYSGMLDRLRFAIDPRFNHFYFGDLP